MHVGPISVYYYMLVPFILFSVELLRRSVKVENYIVLISWSCLLTYLPINEK